MEPITANQAHELLATGNAIIIDVRNDEEFEIAHIESAFPLPLGIITLARVEEIRAKNAADTIIFQCLGGTRSAMAIKKITEEGSLNFKAYNLEGGIKAWIKAGFPVSEYADN